MNFHAHALVISPGATTMREGGRLTNQIIAIGVLLRDCTLSRANFPPSLTVIVVRYSVGKLADYPKMGRNFIALRASPDWRSFDVESSRAFCLGVVVPETTVIDFLAIWDATLKVDYRVSATA
jgi:hypothetical protein